MRSPPSLGATAGETPSDWDNDPRRQAVSRSSSPGVGLYPAVGGRDRIDCAGEVAHRRFQRRVIRDIDARVRETLQKLDEAGELGHVNHAALVGFDGLYLLRKCASVDLCRHGGRF